MEKEHYVYVWIGVSVPTSSILPFFFFFGSVFSIFLTLCHTNGSVHYSRNSQTSFFSNFFIKIWSYGTIHTFKNYFITIFSIFSKISDIQTDFTLSMPFFIQSFKPLLKYLVSQIRYCKRSKERTG